MAKKTKTEEKEFIDEVNLDINDTTEVVEDTIEEVTEVVEETVEEVTEVVEEVTEVVEVDKTENTEVAISIKQLTQRYVIYTKNGKDLKKSLTRLQHRHILLGDYSIL
jgi:methyl-accepting chemotaxis protein